jgi:hypothetical protein
LSYSLRDRPGVQDLNTLHSGHVTSVNVSLSGSLNGSAPARPSHPSRHVFDEDIEDENDHQSHGIYGFINSYNLPDNSCLFTGGGCKKMTALAQDYGGLDFWGSLGTTRNTDSPYFYQVNYHREIMGQTYAGPGSENIYQSSSSQANIYEDGSKFLINIQQYVYSYLN